ncbi:hypothetical protein PybrP1_001582 [[Pythium] brassicae (nom. inval.)]|nr:hypothetical protein PybrP1_001582 [[Pythium] brassicae (nom. inval.)]
MTKKKKKHNARGSSTSACCRCTPSSSDAPPVVAGALVAEFEALNRTVHVRTLAVAPRFRRQGVGRRLVRQLLAQALRLRAALGGAEGEGDAKLASVRLHVHVGNADARAFYTRAGFCEEARLENYYRHLEPRACLVMSYALAGAGAGGETEASNETGNE